MMPIGQFGVDGCHLDGGRAQCGLGDHQGGRQGGGTGVARNIGAGVMVICNHVGDNIYVVEPLGGNVIVIEMVVGE